MRERAAVDPTLHGMGTTAVVAVCRGDELALAHVGDSRAYLLHEGRLRRVTEDHSLVARMVSAGTITAAEARTHHLRNVITRSLGFEETPRPKYRSSNGCAATCSCCARTD